MGVSVDVMGSSVNVMGIRVDVMDIGAMDIMGIWLEDAQRLPKPVA